jgi:5-methylthioadenosine/S-adenosylhomocysteine deaminase
MLLVKGSVIIISGRKVIKGDLGVAIDKEKITDVGKSDELERNHDFDATFGGKNCLIMPGLVNAHVHTHLSLLRGLADNLPQKRWVEEKIDPFEHRLDDHSSFVAALGSVAEMSLSGTTAIADMCCHPEKVVEALDILGVKGLISNVIQEGFEPDNALENTEKNVELFRKYDIVKPSIGPCCPVRTNETHLLEVRRLSRKHHIPIQIHISETLDEVEFIKNKYEMRPVEYLHSLGMLDNDVLAAHCVWVNDNEIDILKEKNVTIAINPSSNLKLATGVAPIHKFVDRGLKVGIGTDSAACNNAVNSFSEMRLASLLAKATSNDATVLPASNALEMATDSTVLGFDGGTIEPGRLADIALIDIEKMSMAPMHNPVSNIVYSANGSEIHTVISGGKVIVQDKKLAIVSEKLLRERIHTIAQKIARDLSR